jgi:hypothetical protein
MRKGYDSKIFMTPKGEMLGFSTGSDCCTEHEQGSREMQAVYCAGASTTEDPAIIEALRGGATVAYPSVVSRKTINQKLDRIKFLEGVDSHNRPTAAILLTGQFYEAIPLSRISALEGLNAQTVTGAWDSESAGIKVVGAELVAKLKVFFDALQAGDGIFGGTFLDVYSGTFEGGKGVLIARSSKLRPEHWEGSKVAQAEFEQDLRLKSRSRIPELHQLRRDQKDSGATSPGYFWPVWKHGVVDGEVVYAVNPSYEANKLIPYFGPYTYEDLAAWTLAKVKYKLTPIPRLAPVDEANAPA